MQYFGLYYSACLSSTPPLSSVLRTKIQKGKHISYLYFIVIFFYFRFLSASPITARVDCHEKESELVHINPSVTLAHSRPAIIACPQQEVEIVDIPPTSHHPIKDNKELPVCQESRLAQCHSTWHVCKRILV